MSLVLACGSRRCERRLYATWRLRRKYGYDSRTMLGDLQRTVRRTMHVLTAVPRSQASDAPSHPAERFRLLELRGQIGAGWHEFAVELRGPSRAPARLLVGAHAHLLPATESGRAVVIVDVPAGAELGLEIADDSPVDVGTIVAREVSRTEAALRRAAPTFLRRLREPWTIPAASLKILRAAWTGELLERLLQRGGGDAQQTFYPEWHALFAALEDTDRAAIRAAAARLPGRFRFSVVLPVYDAPEPFLSRAIGSVREQLYPDWELCIADDASPSPHVRRILERAAREDPRIRVTFRDRNGHISAASNSAASLATGDFVVLLDHDDELAEHALFVLATAASDADLLYSDEDKVDERGRLSSPFFKPDWNPDLLLSQNYVGHLCAIRRSLLREIGGFREGFEGSQDYDLVLRASSRTSRIRHLPFVLYHWRSIAGSTARDATAKSYAEAAARRALEERVGPSATVEPGPLPTAYRVRWQLPQDPPLVSLIVPTRDARIVLEPCIESLLAKTAYRRFELIVVDNQSTDPATLDYLAALERRGVARVARFDAPFNFSAINNLAVRETARGDVVGLLNNDLEIVEPGWLEEMVSHALRPSIGAVGARLLYPDGTLQHGGILLGISGAAGHAHKFLHRVEPGYFGRAQLVHDVSAVTAACLLIRRETYLRVGGMDESFPIAFNDVDFCLRVRALGLRNLWTPFATLVHHESKTRGQEDTPAKKERFEAEKRLLNERWGEALRSDPAYNPNLSLDAEDFSLAWPPRVRKPWL